MEEIFCVILATSKVSYYHIYIWFASLKMTNKQCSVTYNVKLMDAIPLFSLASTNYYVCFAFYHFRRAPPTIATC